MNLQHKKRLKKLLNNGPEEALQAIIEAFSEDYTTLSRSLKEHPWERSEILAKIEKSTHTKWLWILRILNRSGNKHNVVFRICNMQIPDQFKARRNQILTEKIYPSWIKKGWSNQSIRLSRILGISISPDDIELMAENKKNHGRDHSALILEKCARICRSRLSPVPA